MTFYTNLICEIFKRNNGKEMKFCAYLLEAIVSERLSTDLKPSTRCQPI